MPATWVQHQILFNPRCDPFLPLIRGFAPPHKREHNITTDYELPQNSSDPRFAKLRIMWPPLPLVTPAPFRVKTRCGHIGCICVQRSLTWYLWGSCLSKSPLGVIGKKWSYVNHFVIHINAFVVGLCIIHFLSLYHAKIWFVTGTQ